MHISENSPASEIQSTGFTMAVMRPHSKAASLEEYRQVGVLVETSLAAGRDILSGIAEYARRYGRWSIFTYAHDIDEPPPDWFREWPCDGIIVRLHDKRIAESVIERDRPVVDVLGAFHPGRYPLVHTDNVAIGRMAANHFHQRGFASFGYVGLDDENWSVERYEAFSARVAEIGYSCAHLMWSNETERRTILPEQMRIVGDWLRTLKRPAAIFVCNDLRAMTVHEASRRSDFVVGRDIAILGVGNDNVFCEMPSPALSSIDANHKRVGYEAAALLDAMMHGAPAPRHPLLLPPREVVVRESTDFLAVQDKDLQQALSFIRAHAVQGIGVDDVAKACCMSRSVIQRRFREHLGQTIHDSILEEKIRRAIPLIRNTTESIERIARAVGFEYVQSLNKALRRLYGHSASDYRREHSAQVLLAQRYRRQRRGRKT
jgi:LacI family transcriptional regulator